MSNVRQQLHAAKAAYDGMKYPGNLAAEVLFRQKRTSRWMVRAAALGAIAAALTVAAILNFRPNHVKPGGNGAGALATTLKAPPAQESAAVSPVSLEMPGMPQFPEGMSMVPSAGSFADLPGMPLMPSLSTIETEFQEPSPTTQEAL